MEIKETDRNAILLRMFLFYLDSCKALNIDPLFKKFNQFKKVYKNVKLN